MEGMEDMEGFFDFHDKYNEWISRYWDHVDKKIVFIKVVYVNPETREEEQCCGSGVVVFDENNHTVVLTCGHVLEIYFTLSVGEAQVVVEYSHGVSVVANVLSTRHHAKREIGVLHTYVPGAPKLPIARIPKKITKGMRVFMGGHTYGSERIARTRGYLSHHSLPGNIIEHHDLSTVMEFDGLNGGRGASGSGVLDHRGDLVAILFAGKLVECGGPIRHITYMGEMKYGHSVYTMVHALNEICDAYRLPMHSLTTRLASLVQKLPLTPIYLPNRAAQHANRSSKYPFCPLAWKIARKFGSFEQFGAHLSLEVSDEFANRSSKHSRSTLAQNIYLKQEMVMAADTDSGFNPTAHKGVFNVVEAGDAPPENIVAVIRPMAYDSGNSSKNLDQKFIVRYKHAMSVEVKFSASDKNVGKGEPVFSMSQSPSSHKGLHGLYLFPMKSSHSHRLFEKAGFYTFSFALSERKDVRFEQVVQVQASAEVGSCKVVSHNMDELYTVRSGSCFEPLSVACFDRYDNCVVFTSVPKLTINLSSDSTVLARVRSMKVDLTADKSIMKVKDIVVISSKLDDIRPDNEATLDISTLDKAFSVAFPCRVLPGTPHRITVHPRQLRKQLIPGQIIEKLMLEVLDEYGNHANEDEDILMSVDGFSFQDGSSIVHCDGNYLKKVKNGCVDLSNMLKVSKEYGKDVSLCVISEEKLKLNFQTETRKLRSLSNAFKNCEAGSQLENIVFEIVNSEGKVDESIHDEEKHGQSHTLTIKSNLFDNDDSIRYSFRCGRCTIRSIRIPHTEGTYSFSAFNSCFPDLNLDIEVHVNKALEENHEFTVNHEDVGNPVPPSPRKSCENSQIHPHSPLLKDLRTGNKNFSPLIPDEYMSPIGFSPSKKAPKMEDSNAQNKNLDILPIQVSASRDVENFKELEDDLALWGSKMLDHQRKFEILNNSQSQIQQQISDLQASIARNNPNVSSMFGHEWTLEQIKSKSQSAAAFFCKLLEKVPCKSKPRNKLGVVALPGTTQSIELSRMLAQYLGEDLMLAIVCENYSAALEFENNTLHKLASKIGQPITGGYLALFLDDIRSSITEPCIGLQNLLTLQPPTLPGGDVPQGFSGYAVNLISMEPSHLQWRRKSDHGLREILFYRLLVELQVYRDRNHALKTELSLWMEGHKAHKHCSCWKKVSWSL